MTKLVVTIRLSGEAPWTTPPCEQLHGSLALFHRWRPEFGQSVPLSKAFMLQLCRVAAPSVTKAEK
eukprot:6412634-Lingulodinium_polyedra.AAC.1